MTKLRLFFLLLISFNVSAETFQATIGVIAAENKPVEIKSKTLDGKIITRSVLIGQPVYLNDEITTQENNKIQILLKDQTAFSMGANSSIVVDKFVYDPNKPELTANIKKGAFKFVSGKISEMKKDTMKVSIPNSVIAVRGTSVAGAINPDGSSTVVLLHGAIGLMNGSSSVDITKPGYGSQVSNTGIISSPIPIPASTIRSITTSVQTQGVNSSSSGQTNNSSTSALNTTSSNNLTNIYNNISNSTYQNLNQILTTQGAGAATAAYFNLYGINVNDPNVDINYALRTLPPAAQLELIAISKTDSLTRLATKNWLGYTGSTLNGSGTWQGFSGIDQAHVLGSIADYLLNTLNLSYSQEVPIMALLSPSIPSHTYPNIHTDIASITSALSPGVDPTVASSYNSFTLIDSDLGIAAGNYTNTPSHNDLSIALSAYLQPLTLTQFTNTGIPTINYVGNATPIQNIYFNVASAYGNPDGWGILSPDSSLSGHINQELTLDFLHGVVTNKYSITFDPLTQQTFSNIPTQISTVDFSKLRNLGNNSNVLLLPTNPTTDGSTLVMTGAFVMDNKSLLLHNTNITNASAGMLGAYISKGNVYLVGSQPVSGIINKSP